MQLVAVTREAHAKQCWKHPPNHLFAATQALLPLVVAELPAATVSFPIGFVAQGERFVPMAVLGFKPGQNLFVTPDGRWMAPYVPAAIRCYPFHLAQSEGGEKVLCVDTDSGLIGEAGEPFLHDGEPTQAVRDVITHLTQTEQSRGVTVKACAVLQAHKLIVPWQISVQGDQGKQQIEGLFKIDEAALNQLPGAALQELMQSGAMALAYCQMLSTQHLQKLGELSHALAAYLAKQAPAPLPMAGKDLDLGFLTSGDTMSFRNF